MKSVAAILVALCLIHLQDSHATVKVLRKSLVVPDKKIAFWFQSYTDEHLTYALCDRHSEGDEIKCTVIREKQPYGNDTYACDVILKRPHGHYDPDSLPRMSVYSFGQKYAALTIFEDVEYLNFTVVQMDSCNVSKTGFYTGSLLDWLYTPVIGHNDSFDVFFNNADLCGDKMCKTMIGADGRLINDAKPSIKQFAHTDHALRSVVGLDNSSFGNGYFYLTKDVKNDYNYILVKPDGTEKSLLRHPKPSGLVAISNKNNLLGVCYQLNDKFECDQYDFNGNLKLRTTITSTITDDHHGRAYFDIYNLANGGFYVVSIECLKGSHGQCFDLKEFLIERVDANGTKTGPIVFQRPEDLFEYDIRVPLFYENDTKEICFSLAATKVVDNSDGGRIELTANCFTDNNFNN